MNMFRFYLIQFLQQIGPLVVLAMALWYLLRYRFRRGNTVPARLRLFRTLLAGCVAGLIGLAWLWDLTRDVWHAILYRSLEFSLPAPKFEISLIVDFWKTFTAESLGNLLMYVPFGVLLPLSQPKLSWKKAFLIGLALILGIEAGQVFFGRHMDINDIILNSVGLLFAVSAVFTMRRLRK